MSQLVQAHPSPSQNMSTSAKTITPTSPRAGPIHIGVREIIISAIPLTLVVFLTTYLQLGIDKSLSTAALRALVQLSLLGYFLVPIFTFNKPWMVLGTLLIMLLVASNEAVRRPTYRYPRMMLDVALCLGTNMLFFGIFVFGIVLNSGFDARYTIPVGGMMMGGALNGISLALSSILTEFAERKSKIEMLLGFGASRWEAAGEAICESVRLGMTPVINQMAVTGVVSIPGMMTGQILGGTAPHQAAHYQILILFWMSACTCLSILSAALVSVYRMTDDEHRIRKGFLSKEEVSSLKSDVVGPILMGWRKFMLWRRFRSTGENDSPLPIVRNERADDDDSYGVSEAESEHEEANGNHVPSSKVLVLN